MSNVIYIERRAAPRRELRPGALIVSVAMPFMVGAVLAGIVVVESINFGVWLASFWRGA